MSSPPKSHPKAGDSTFVVLWINKRLSWAIDFQLGTFSNPRVPACSQGCRDLDLHQVGRVRSDSSCSHTKILPSRLLLLLVLDTARLTNSWQALCKFQLTTLPQAYLTLLFAIHLLHQILARAGTLITTNLALQLPAARRAMVPVSISLHWMALLSLYNGVVRAITIRLITIMIFVGRNGH